MVNNSFIELSSPHFNAAKSNADLVRVRISSAEIASGHVGPVVDQLMELSDTALGVLRWKDKLIIGIDKKPYEPRDVSQIFEVVSFFRQLTSQWPFWAYFVEKECGTMGAVLRLLIGTESLLKGATCERMLLTNADEVRSKSKWLFDQMKHLYRCHGLPETDEIETAKAITQAVNAMFYKA